VTASRMTLPLHLAGHHTSRLAGRSYAADMQRYWASAPKTIARLAAKVEATEQLSSAREKLSDGETRRNVRVKTTVED
jgi:hypothetical protein